MTTRSLLISARMCARFIKIASARTSIADLGLIWRVSIVRKSLGKRECWVQSSVLRKSPAVVFTLPLSSNSVPLISGRLCN
jgi:hypothetical protein